MPKRKSHARKSAPPNGTIDLRRDAIQRLQSQLRAEKRLGLLARQLIRAQRANDLALIKTINALGDRLPGHTVTVKGQMAGLDE